MTKKMICPYCKSNETVYFSTTSQTEEAWVCHSCGEIFTVANFIEKPTLDTEKQDAEVLTIRSRKENGIFI